MTGLSSIADMFAAGEVETFLGLPRCEDPSRIDARVAILGVPSVTPYRRVGAYCANAPRAIRDAVAGYAANLHHVDFDLGGAIFPDGVVDAVDCGDMPCDDEDFARNRSRLAALVGGLLDRGAVPVLIGGDDSVPIPMFEAFAGRGEFTILQVDAHIDWRDEVDGERYGLSSNMRRASEMPHVTRIIQAGQRAIGSARASDYADALRWGVEFCPAREIAARGIGPVLERVPSGGEVIMALDVDGLDPGVVPGVIGRAPGGLSYWQMVDLIHGVAARSRIAAFSLVEFMPERDVDGLGALVAARILANVVGALARAPRETRAAH